MNIIQKLGVKILNIKAAQYLPQQVLRFASSMFGINSPVYMVDNPQLYVKMGFNQNALVYQIVSFIANKGAAMDYAVRVYRNGEVINDTKNHPLIDLLYRPNPLQGKAEFLEQAFGYYLTTGNLYNFAPRLEEGANKGQTTQIYNMPAHFMQVVPGAYMGEIAEYQLIAGGTRKLKVTDVLHVKKANLDFENDESFYGMSPLKAGWRTLMKANANEDASNAMFQNLGIAGILSNIDENADYTQEQIDSFEHKFNTKFAGSKNAGKIWVNNTKVQWQEIGLSPVDMALIEDYKMNRQILCGLYGVSSSLFNDSEASTFNNMKEARKAAYTDAILPMVNAYLDAFNKWISQSYAKPGEYVELYAVTDNIPELQQDKAELANWLNVAWWVSFNEKRTAMGFKPDDNYEGKYLIPAALIDIDDDAANNFEV